MKGDIHIHSKYSPDCISEPEVIIKWAKSKGLDFISISDHNRFRIHKGDIMIVPAEEVSSEDGHVLALFIEQEIPSGKTQEETVDTIHDNNGIAISAHTFRLINGVKKGFKDIYDAIETKNGRCMKHCNRKSEELAKRLNKPGTAGSDAHFYEEVGRVYMKVEDSDMEGIRKSIMNGKVENLGDDLTITKQFSLYYKMGSEYVKRGLKRI